MGTEKNPRIQLGLGNNGKYHYVSASGEKGALAGSYHHLPPKLENILIQWMKSKPLPGASIHESSQFPNSFSRGLLKIPGRHFMRQWEMVEQILVTSGRSTWWRAASSIFKACVCP